jgi:FemAB-related protein (PEP-CTERM system-associated)
VTVRVSTYDGTAAEWDAFVRAQPGWTHFHLHGWKDVVERVYGHECIYLEAREAAGALEGVLPLVRVRSALFGHYLVSMPFLNYGGPLGTEAAVRALGERAVALARDGGVKLLELRSRVPLPLELPVSHRKVTVVLDLPADAGALWSALGAKLRSQIKRPQKEGVTLRFGASEAEPFFAVFSAHMRDLGTPTQPRALFRAVAERFGEDAWFGCAYYGGRPVACGAGFRWGGEFEMTWASSLAGFNRIAPNMLLYWSFMERAVAEGVTLFNFGRCTPGAGTHRFKRQWGSRDEPLWWYQRAAGGAAATPSPDDPAYSWGPRLWRRLPLPLATALGPRIVRGIP